MINGIIQALDGKRCHIVDLELKSLDEQMDLQLTLSSENELHRLKFSNVRDLKLDANHPFTIGCFEIIDTSGRGWEADRRYRVHDVDDDSISFYCRAVAYDT